MSEVEAGKGWRRQILTLGRVEGGILPSQEAVLQKTPTLSFCLDSLIVSSTNGLAKVNDPALKGEACA